MADGPTAPNPTGPPAASAAGSPLRVAVANDYEIVVAGLARMLSRYPDRIVVADRIIIGEPVEAPVAVALYDTYGRVGVAEPALRLLAATPTVARVAVFTLDFHPELVTRARDSGATGFISKALSGHEVVDALERVARGEEVMAVPRSRRPAAAELDWPGKHEGLTERQSQVLVLAAEGLSNREIAAALYLSTNTVKSYLKAVFERLELRNRVEATNFVHSHGTFVRIAPGPQEGVMTDQADSTLGLRTTRLDDTATVRVVGEVDITNAPDLEDVLNRLIDDGAAEVVVDLSEVGFIDSSGLRSLVLAQKRLARNEGGRIQVAGASVQVAKVFEITGLTELLAPEPGGG